MNQEPQHDLRNNSIRWLAKSCGELQRQIEKLQSENVELRRENKLLSARVEELIGQRGKAMAAGKGA